MYVYVSLDISTPLCIYTPIRIYLYTNISIWSSFKKLKLLKDCFDKEGLMSTFLVLLLKTADISVNTYLYTHTHSLFLKLKFPEGCFDEY